MQCCYNAIVLYPQTHRTRYFQPPRFSVTPPSPQLQEEPISYDEKSKLITSASNPFVKHCLKLRNNSSYRHSHGSVILVGATPIREICRFQESAQDKNVNMDCLILPEKAEIPDGLDESTDSIVRVSSIVMRKISGLQSTDSIDAIGLMKIPASFLNLDDNKSHCQKWFPSAHRILVLDGIQDGVFLLPGCCDPFNEKALRASRGASFQLPIVSGCWSHLESLKEEFQMKLLAGHPEHDGLVNPVCSLSPSLCESISDTPMCLVLGSEGSGLSEKSMKSCELVSIAMTGEYESLNVSVAGGIFMYMLQSKNK
ncbi:hypothetical protein KIW84_043486 [Lathyrus oleraceus]|uniref:tRNA/rRNA methyltransferase SpoU type domain-containing protein n=1 Tax=Pisum sativum TaxID=3888 RepID=A0A9D4XHJ4_PEA|nr:hypothetical protein KIW84_043486 [Pisum sativum]